MSTATISNMTQAHGGYWIAAVSDGTDTIHVDNRIGPWTTPVDPDGRHDAGADHSSKAISRRELVPAVSAKLRELARQGGGDAIVSFTPATRPKTPTTPKLTTVQTVAQQMAAAGAAAIGKAA